LLANVYRHGAIRRGRLQFTVLQAGAGIALNGEKEEYYLQYLIKILQIVRIRPAKSSC